MYPAAYVRALAARPEIDTDALRVRFPEGVLVGRLDPRRSLPAGPWTVRPIRWVALDWVARSRGPTPLICTVNGFVLSVHEVVGRTWQLPRARGEQPRLTFDLQPAGPWRSAVLGHRFDKPPGHPLWTWNAPLLPQEHRPDELSAGPGPWEVRRSRPRAGAG